MPHLRYITDIAIPCDNEGNPINPQANGVIAPLEAAIKNAKKFAVKINEGEANEGNTVKAGKHICKHDINQPCDAEIEI